MTIWLDAQLSPLIAAWINDEFHTEAIPIRDIGMRDVSDREIFFSARKSKAIIMTKDFDFVELITHYGKPPQIILITCGNTSNDRLKKILQKSFNQVLVHINNGEAIVEISDSNV